MFSIYSEFVNGTKFCAAEELQNLDLDSDSSFTSRELANFDREKLPELAFEKDQAKKNR